MCPLCFHSAPCLCDDDGFSNRKCNNIPNLASNTYLRRRKWLDNCVIRNDATVRLLSDFEPILSLTGLIFSANLSSTSLIALRIWISSRRLNLKSSRMPVSCEAYSALLHGSCSIFPVSIEGGRNSCRECGLIQVGFGMFRWTQDWIFSRQLLSPYYFGILCIAFEHTVRGRINCQFHPHVSINDSLNKVEFEHLEQSNGRKQHWPNIL